MRLQIPLSVSMSMITHLPRRSAASAVAVLLKSNNSAPAPPTNNKNALIRSEVGTMHFSSGGGGIISSATAAAVSAYHYHDQCFRTVSFPHSHSSSIQITHHHDHRRRKEGFQFIHRHHHHHHIHHSLNCQLRTFLTAPVLHTEMIDVTFITDEGKKLTTKGKIGDNILDVVVNNSIDLDGFGAYEGTLACSTCHLVFKKVDFDKIKDKVTDEELDVLDLAYGLTDTSRLGCQVTLTKELDGVEVQVPAGVIDQRS